jgi:hypothetical protein
MGRDEARADAALRRAAIEIMGLSRDHRAVPALLAQLGSFEAETVARALDRIGDASILPELRGRARDLSNRRDRAAVEALIRSLERQREALSADGAPAAKDEPGGRGETAPSVGSPGHKIEVAKSGRAACRTCRELIAKGELRLGEEAPNPYSDSGGTSFRWHHLRCAAARRPQALQIALGRYEGTLPERAELEQAIETWERKRAARGVPVAFPYAERAPTGRSRCLQCEAVIAKGALRVAVQREVQAGAMVTQGPGYLHAACARAYVSDENLLETLRAHSPGLSAPDAAELAAALGPRPAAE